MPSGMGSSAGARACPDRRGDIAAYLVGALDSQAGAEVRRHLGSCPACRAEYEDLVPVAGCLALLTTRLRGRPGTMW